jgi:hypothetical protein
MARECALGDFPGDRDAVLVHLAALHGEHLPEFALGVRALRHGELAVEYPRIARRVVGRLEEALVDLALAIDSARADDHDDLGEAPVGNQFAALLRLGVVHVEHRGHPLLY